MKRIRRQDPDWFPQDYTSTLIRSRRKFLPELIPNMLLGIGLRVESVGDEYYWAEEWEGVTRTTLLTCCLVCHEWNRIFTPILYRSITLGRNTSPTALLLLRLTLRHMQPSHLALIRRITVETNKDEANANLWLAVSLRPPNLRTLTLDRLDPDRLHPRFAHQLRSLSQSCTIELRRGFDHGGSIEWESIPKWIKFLKRARPTLCELGLDDATNGSYESR